MTIHDGGIGFSFTQGLRIHHLLEQSLKELPESGKGHNGQSLDRPLTDRTVSLIDVEQCERLQHQSKRS